MENEENKNGFADPWSTWEETHFKEAMEASLAHYSGKDTEKLTNHTPIDDSGNLKNAFKGFPNTSKKRKTCSPESCDKCGLEGVPCKCRTLAPPKIQRRVYLCAACETYFENWNLFLHMREVHNRHICLFCLGMFAEAERLSDHLMKKHNVPEIAFASTEEFYGAFKGSCNLVCCACETMFSEADNFYNHYCSTKEQQQIKIEDKMNVLNSNGSSGPFVPNENKKIRFSKRVIKPSRHINMDDVYLYSSLTNKAKKTIARTGVSPVKPPPETSLMEIPKLPMAEEEDVKDSKENIQNDVNNMYSYYNEQEHKEKMEFMNFNTTTEDPKNEDDIRLTPDFTMEDMPKSSHSDLESQKSSDEAPEVEKEFCATPVSDRKLVIKICTKNNSMYSVSASSVCETQTNGLPNDLHSSDSELEYDVNKENEPKNDGIILADKSTAILDLNIDGLLDSIDIQDLLKLCISTVSGTCVYCNHARHIAVNGKQLSLHMLAEHRFQPQHPAIVLEEDQFITKIKKDFESLESSFLNLESYDSKRGTYNIGLKVDYECFHCRFYAANHKDLYLHNRKMHQKIILICVMCKSTFYSYSQVLCHLCPGTCAISPSIKYRCCFCATTDLPSSFRLMVHLRRYHHACEICLECVGDQQRLSSHVWKHKLSHYCYRCGIGYRNKPDITNHLFWKHGTESVLCKKCLQKKWPHIYHFCASSGVFECEECGASFTKAVALRVHKRLHSNDFPYACSECPEKLISKKLLAKHELSHKEPPPSSPVVETIEPHIDVEGTDSPEKVPQTVKEEEIEEKIDEPEKKVVDVLDLPPLNLSDSDSDSEDEGKTKEVVVEEPEEQKSPNPESMDIVEVERNEEEKKVEEEIMDGIWDNFKSFMATTDNDSKTETSNLEVEKMIVDSPKPEVEKEIIEGPSLEALREIINADHDYCFVEPKQPEAEPEKEPEPSCLTPKKKTKSPKKKKTDGGSSSSDSSSDSDSSSCTCGSNCSCSSSSSSGDSSSNSSSDSDSSTASPKKHKKGKSPPPLTEQPMVNETIVEKPEPVAPEPPKVIIRESDLETTETETDEDFYDENPEQYKARILAETRNKVLLETKPPSPVNNGAQQVKKKTKSSRKGKGTARRKKANGKSLKIHIPKPTISREKQEKIAQPNNGGLVVHPILNNYYSPMMNALSENPRSSKRKRVPKKFYDDSSDEEDFYRQQMLKWKRYDPPPPTPLPPPTDPAPAPPAILLENQQQQELGPEGNNKSGTSSDSENESTLNLLQPPLLVAPPRQARNLYCYCQSVYDEVSEMIACDGDNCRIEWFHFDCVGIASPPNGKWYCPDCQKSEGIVPNKG